MVRTAADRPSPPRRAAPLDGAGRRKWDGGAPARGRRAAWTIGLREARRRLILEALGSWVRCREAIGRTAHSGRRDVVQGIVRHRFRGTRHRGGEEVRAGPRDRRHPRALDGGSANLLETAQAAGGIAERRGDRARPRRARPRHGPARTSSTARSRGAATSKSPWPLRPKGSRMYSRRRRRQMSTRSPRPDLLQLFLKDIGRVDLLTAAQEVELAKRVEARRTICARSRR